MTLWFRKFDFIWQNKNDWVKSCYHRTKKHYQR